LTHPGSYLSSLIKENVSPFFDTLGLSSPLRALTTWFWPDDKKLVLVVELKIKHSCQPISLFIVSGQNQASPSGCQGRFALVEASGGAVP